MHELSICGYSQNLQKKHEIKRLENRALLVYDSQQTHNIIVHTKQLKDNKNGYRKRMSLWFELNACSILDTYTRYYSPLKQERVSVSQSDSELCVLSL